MKEYEIALLEAGEDLDKARIHVTRFDFGEPRAPVDDLEQRPCSVHAEQCAQRRLKDV